MAEVKKQEKSWSKGLKTEFDKIVWTDRKTLLRQTIAVVVISVVVCVLITLVDNASLALIEQIIR